jgi:hypothetical protein
VRAYALFSDGTSVDLRVELDAGPEPKVFLLGCTSRELLLSAERGARAAYFALRRRGLLRHAYATFFEMASAEDRALPVLGESAGLCFALAFAAHALAREHPHACPVAFAATGTLRTGTVDAEVGAVDALEAKFAAALASLPPGAWILFPAADAAELADATRLAAAAKGIHCVAVRTVEEAVGMLAEQILGPRAGSWSRRGRWVATGLTATVMLVIGWTLLWQVEAGRAARLAGAARAGNFGDLGWQRLPLARLLPIDGGLRALEEQAHREINLVLSLHSRSEGDVPPADVEGMPQLAAGDRYRLALEPSRDCYLYAVQIDAWGSGTVLFPNTSLTAERNPLRGGHRYWLPDSDRWLVLDNRPGKETIVVIAAPWPAEDLEALFAEVPSGVASANANQLFGAIAQRAAIRKEARLGGLRGIAYEEIPFAHQ